MARAKQGFRLGASHYQKPTSYSWFASVMRALRMLERVRIDAVDVSGFGVTYQYAPLNLETTRQEC